MIFLNIFSSRQRKNGDSGGNSALSIYFQSEDEKTACRGPSIQISTPAR
jgi:hypothetical protein